MKGHLLIMGGWLCVRLFQCVCATVPTSKLSGTRTHAHTFASAVFSPWVVCAANVYDLNQANPTGWFQRIENDLQDADTDAETKVEIRANLRAPLEITL